MKIQSQPQSRSIAGVFHAFPNVSNTIILDAKLETIITARRYGKAQSNR